MRGRESGERLEMSFTDSVYIYPIDRFMRQIYSVPGERSERSERRRDTMHCYGEWMDKSMTIKMERMERRQEAKKRRTRRNDGSVNCGTQEGTVSQVKAHSVLLTRILF